MAILKDGTNSAEFEADLAAGNMVLAEVYTPDCVICKRIEPMVAALEANLEGRVVAYKVDAARDPAFAERHNVRGLPTILLFQNAALADRKTGFMTMTMLKDWVGLYLQGGKSK